MSPLRLTAALLGAALVLWAEPIQAKPLGYTPASDTALEAVARAVYGRSGAVALLAAANQLDDNAVARAGVALQIPVSYSVDVQHRTPLVNLARQHLQGREHAELLAMVNRLDAAQPVAAGTRLVIPALVWHTVARGDTFRGLSRRYYRHADGRWLLRALSSDRAAKKPPAGERLVVPIFAPWTDRSAVQARLDVITQPAASSAPAAAAVGDDGDDDAAVPGADLEASDSYAEAVASPLIGNGLALYRRGDFLACVSYFRRALLDPGLPAPQRVAAQVWLASCYVAADETDRAEEALQSALQLGPWLRLDPVQTSPKVLQVLARVQARRQAAAPPP